MIALHATARVGMSDGMLGIIGGTGVGEALFGSPGREINVETPFGKPSGAIRIVSYEGVDVAVLARHGDGHVFPPSAVPYRANVFALKKVGVTRLLVTGAIGSLREEIRPRDLVVVDQIIDRTYTRAPTFFDRDVAVHVELAQPYCAALRASLVAAAGPEGAHARGTYVCVEGPSFSTVAEAHAHRAWGADVVGMTAMPEARLAREAEMCCALLAFATDYDCWRTAEHGKPKEALLAEIIGHVEAATERASAVLRKTVAMLARRPDDACACRSALSLAIWSRRDAISKDAIVRYGPLLEKYIRP
jgi:5'-methylthioadenosine phosphorylase